MADFEQVVVVTLDRVVDIVEHELLMEQVRVKMKEKGEWYALIHHLHHCHFQREEHWQTFHDL